MPRLYKILLLLLLLPTLLTAQPGSSADQDITGLWKGSLYNDTTQQYLHFEIAISEEKGKLSGYSYTVFDIGGKLEIGVKRIKIKRKGDELTIEDAGMINNNFSVPAPRGVKVKGVVTISINDTAMLLGGRWSTNPTNEFRPITGSMQLQRAADFKPVALYKKLAELKLEKDLSFVKYQRVPPDVAVVSPPKTNPVSETAVPGGYPDADTKTPVRQNIPAPVIAANTTPIPQEKEVPLPTKIYGEVAIVQLPKTALPKQKTIVKSTAINEKARAAGAFVAIIKSPPVTEVVKKEIAPVTDIAKKTDVNKKPAAIIPPAESKQPVSVAKENAVPKKPAATDIAKKPATTIVKPATPAPVVKKTAPVSAPPVAVKKEVTKPVATVVSPPVAIPIAKTDIPKKENLPPPVILNATPAAEDVDARKISSVQSVFYQSDSLMITLYDNGEIDGDTVSVLINGVVFISKQGLNTRANSKTFYITADTPDSLMLVMYAENLGSIPPNTGLLVLHDGEAVYEVRFRADLQSNAAILLTRKRKE